MLFTTSVIDYKACQGDTITFSCSADAKPAVTSYHLFKNDTAIDVSLSGMWSETLASEGVFFYKCVAKNSLGIAASTDVSVTLNGKPCSSSCSRFKNTCCEFYGNNLFFKKCFMCFPDLLDNFHPIFILTGPLL